MLALSKGYYGPRIPRRAPEVLCCLREDLTEAATQAWAPQCLRPLEPILVELEALEQALGIKPRPEARRFIFGGPQTLLRNALWGLPGGAMPLEEAQALLSRAHASPADAKWVGRWAREAGLLVKRSGRGAARGRTLCLYPTKPNF